jgi:hypothetical protein
MVAKETSTRVAAVAVVLFSSALWCAEGAAIPRTLQPFIDRHEPAGAMALVVSKETVLSIETLGCADIAAASSCSRTHLIFPSAAAFWFGRNYFLVAAEKFTQDAEACPARLLTLHRGCAPCSVTTSPSLSNLAFPSRARKSSSDCG